MVFSSIFIIVGAILAFGFGRSIYLFIKGENPQLVGSLLFSLIGVLPVGAGCAIAWHEYRFRERAESVSGQIVSNDKTLAQDSDGKYVDTYQPKVRFTTLQNQTIEFYGASSRYRDYEAGERVEVIYPPEQPEQARIKGFPWLYLVAAGLAAMSFVFIGIYFRAAYAAPQDAGRINQTKPRRQHGL